MRHYLVKENIYDEKGILLLRKDEVVSQLVVEKLKIHRIPGRSLCSIKSPKPSRIRPINKEEFRQKYRIKKNFDYPSKILEKIIFESKDEHWWLHVNVLSNYIDWLYTHSIDTALISLMMAVELHYKEEQLWNLGLGALLHDAGKLLIPKRLINQSDSIDDMEKKILRQHCELGADSVKSYGINDECIDIILHHHERMDGSGYPNGLTGNEISLNCQIVMIADTISMITSGTTNDPESMDMAIHVIENSQDKYSRNIFQLFKKYLD